MASPDHVGPPPAPTTGGQRPRAFLRESDSILAPLLVGISMPQRGMSLMGVMLLAARSVPAVAITRRVGKRAEPTPHARQVIQMKDESGETYSFLVRCCDVGPNESASEGFARWNWEVGIFAFKDYVHYPDLVPESHELFRLDVTRFRIQNQGVVAAHQLALFRHLFVEGFRALDPAALVYGGQRDWEPAWWPDPQREQ